MMDGIAEAGRYWFIWKCVEAGIILTIVGVGAALAHRFLKDDDKEA